MTITSVLLYANYPIYFRTHDISLSGHHVSLHVKTSPYMTITSLYVPGYHICLREDVTYVTSPYGAITFSVTKTSSFGCHISRHLIIVGYHISRRLINGLSHLTASHHLVIITHGITSFGCHISRHLIIWLSYLTVSHHLAVTSPSISSFGCHISRHLIIWLSYLTASHNLAVISHGISSSGCQISRHLINWLSHLTASPFP